jgi:hypothetical protein
MELDWIAYSRVRSRTHNSDLEACDDSKKSAVFYKGHGTTKAADILTYLFALQNITAVRSSCRPPDFWYSFVLEAEPTPGP